MSREQQAVKAAITAADDLTHMKRMLDGLEILEENVQRAKYELACHEREMVKLLIKRGEPHFLKLNKSTLHWVRK